MRLQLRSPVAAIALSLLLLLAGSASLPAVDLYVNGFNNTTQKSVFGKIDSDTGVYSQINSDVAASNPQLSGQQMYGLAWNPAISQFNTLTEEGSLSTITTTGTVGSWLATGLSTATNFLAYNPATSTMYALNDETLSTVNPATGALSNIGVPGVYSNVGSAFVNGTMYGTANIGSSRSTDLRYGSFNLSTGEFTAITASNDFSYSGMLLTYDGTTLFGLSGTTLYTLNPTSGAYTTLRSVTGFSNGSLTAMSAPFAVPEPSTYALAAIATGVMAAIARRRKARKA
jgi:hypothetical protein